MRDRLAAAAGLIVLLAGVVSVVSALLPEQWSRLSGVVALLGLPVTTGAAADSVVLGVVLVLLARGLRRRQRRRQRRPRAAAGADSSESGWPAALPSAV